MVNEYCSNGGKMHFVNTYMHRICLLVLCAVFSLCSGCGIPGFEKENSEEKNAQLRLREQKEKNIVEQPTPKPDHLTLARQLIAKGYHDVGLVQLREAKKQDCDQAEVYYLAGVCHREENRLDEAEKKFRRSIRLDANFAPAHDGLGVTLYVLGRKAEAFKEFSRAVELNPGRADFRNNLGHALLQERDLKEAEKHLRKSVMLQPDFSLAWNNLGFCLAFLGNEAEALDAFGRIMPQAEAYNNLGTACEHRGEYRSALRFYRKALDESPNLAQAEQNATRMELQLETAERKTTTTNERIGSVYGHDSPGKKNKTEIESHMSGQDNPARKENRNEPYEEIFGNRR